MRMIRVLIDLNNKRRGDIIRPNNDIWQYWADNKCVFERSLICEYIEPEIKEEKVLKPERKRKNK